MSVPSVALDIGSAAFHEVWITDQTLTPIPATEAEPTDRPIRTPSANPLRPAGANGLDFFDQVLD
jgi:hypothetical protein